MEEWRPELTASAGAIAKAELEGEGEIQQANALDDVLGGATLTLATLGWKAAPS